MNFLSLNIQGFGNKAKRRWIKELCQKHRINFASIQETKAESISLHTIKDLSCCRIFSRLFRRWEGDTVIMGDFNEVRSKHKRFGSTFNRQGAIAFNKFISSACLIDLPLEGYAFIWAHKSASKMSKLDHYLISEGVLDLFPHLSALCLDRHLSDHRPILLREKNYDYGPSPFRDPNSQFVGLLLIDQVQDLERTVTYEEVKRAVWDCGTNKSLGPDGFSFEFYRNWISSCLNNGMGSVLVNGSHTLEFQFHKGLKQGISLNESFTISHLFYADDVVFIGIGVSSNFVAAAASLIGCSILTAPFNYLGVKVGSNMRPPFLFKVGSHIDSALSYVLFKVPIGVLNHLESIRRNFFYGVDGSDMKLAWIGWNMVLTSKKNGGLGDSSFFAHNCALLFKWVWRFLTDGSSLWTRFIKAIFGNKRALYTHKLIPRRSPWQDVILAIHSLQSKCINLMDFIQTKVGNGENTSFWDDSWLVEVALK
nr:RNA-directed DNA polymerase, eukaryota [Tanacetum cinerariifolium]